MRILFIASEVAPYSKTGGLADVAGALPAALAERGHELMVVTPLYSVVKDPAIARLDASVTLRFPFGEASASLWAAQRGKGHRVVFIDQPFFFARPGIYVEGEREYEDNHRRFAFFSIAALSAAQRLSFAPDIVHLNDWQTGLAALALSRGYQATSLARAKSVFTIHNLAYQGVFTKRVMEDLGLPWELYNPTGLEFHGAVSFLKGGLAFSDALTTVSRRYAEEIQTPEGGHGLHGLLRARREALHGILNGVDYDEWNPETDRHLPAHYSARNLSNKELCKKELLKRFGLPVPQGEARTPLFGSVSRLAEQKGIDLLLHALPRVLERELSVVVLGAGESRYEQGLRALRERYPRKVGVKIGFDPALAHLVEAGSDFFLMPSLFEPCGLNQLYSLRYGTVPVVREVGGLDDTVADLASPKATGIKFRDYSPMALVGGIHRALDLYPDRKRMNELRTRGMGADFSWDASAKQYEALYASLA